MDEQIRRVLYNIEDMLSTGYTSEDVNNYVATLDPELRERVRLTQHQQIPGGAVGDFARMGLQGLTFGFADELIGKFAGPEARERSRQNLSVRRSTDLPASLMSEIAGGVALPTFAVGRGVRAGQTTRQLAATGATVGALEGAAFGAGESVEGERESGAVTGGLIGAATGGVAAPVGGSVARRVAPRARSLVNKLRGIDPDTPGPGPRVASSLVERSGIEANVNEAMALADQSLEEISATVFSKLDEEFPEVSDASVTTFIRGLTDNKDTRSVVGAVSRELRDNIGDGVQPSFSQVQDIRRRLIRKGLSDEADELSDIMEEAFGERFTAANAEWRRLSRVKEALELGEKSWNLGANQLERRLGGMGADERTAFQQGRLSEIVQRLQRRETGAVTPLTDFLDAGPSTRRQLRTLFDTDAAFNGFMEELQLVGSEVAERGQKPTPGHVRRLLRWLIPTAGAGAGGAQLMDMLRGN